jgi:hypothetical protein
MDTFIDQLVESYVDYGGVLVKNVKGVRPEIVDLRTITFCDQTDILSGPFAIKHYLSPSQLREMADKGWDEAAIDLVVLKSEAHKQQDKEDNQAKTPGRYIEVYEVQNVKEMDYDITSNDEDVYMYHVAFVSDQNGNTEGVVLNKKRVPDIDKLFKFLKRDPVQGRTLGFGGVEELFEPQVWTNFAEIHGMGMLEHASKIWYKSTDPKFKGQNLSNRDNGWVANLSGNTDISQIDNTPRNLAAFDNKVIQMHEHALEMGAASDLALGRMPTSGTPFKSVERQLVEGNSLHKWRQGRIAVFVDEIYREWSIPHITKEIVKGSKFLSELSSDEMVYISQAVSRNVANQKMKEALFNFNLDELSTENLAELQDLTSQEFARTGNKKFIEILKNEIKDEKVGVTTNIVGKQKDMDLLTDKMVNYVRQLIATPEIRQDPEMVKHINQILESSGMSPVSFGPRTLPAKQEGSASTQGLKELAEADKSQT